MSSPPDEHEQRTTVQPRGLVQAATTALPDPHTVPATVAMPRPEDQAGHALSVGTRLGEFEITKRLGEGGFSIVYLAWDHSLDRHVALKEYMPMAIASRAGNTTVSARSERHRETYELGLRSFVNEAKLLAQFDHPALVKVYRFWEANGTAYMIMPFYQGVTLRDTVRARPAPPDEAWIVALLQPLVQALNVIHAAQCYHRDIAPDNVILLAETGKPLLLDFGAARRLITGLTQQLTVILKPGYAPIEQYDEIPGMKQGPWTDVYALAAVVHWLITGKTPPPSVGRMLQDSYVPLVTVAAGRYSEHFLKAVDRALVVLPAQRTASVDALLMELGADEAPATAAPLPRPQTDPEATVIRPRTQLPPQLRSPTTDMPANPSAPVSSPPVAPVATLQVTPPVAVVTPAPRQQATASNPTAAAPRGLVFGGLAAAVLGLAAAGWWLTREPAPATRAPATPTAATEARSTPTSASPQLHAPAPPAGLTPPPTPTVEVPTAATPTPPPAPPPASVEAAPTKPAAPVKPSTSPPAKARTTERQHAGHAAQCASVLQRMSLGDSSPELIEQVKTLGCR